MKKLLILLTLFFLIPTAKVWAADFTLVFKNEKYVIDQKIIAQWKGAQTINQSNIIRPKFNLRDELLSYPTYSAVPNSPKQNFSYRLSPIYTYINFLSSQIDQRVQEPVLEFSATSGLVSTFVLPQNGQKLDVYDSSLKALMALEENKASSELSVFETSPQKTLAEINNLGIQELVGFGESNFSGSPQNRRHNIAVGVQKMTGIIIAPEETFSFNHFLGPVDGEHGFLPELVIKKTGTIPEFGGGLCQVSSTVFRAAMNAGLPILERRNHAYAVQYYSPQGTDATIYPGSADLKFKNNFSSHILIWPTLIGKNNLKFEIYGTKDDRLVTLEKPIQYDKKPDGSMKAEWTRIIVKDGLTSSSTFKSVYFPPALFHKTEEFATSTASGLQMPAGIN